MTTSKRLKTVLRVAALQEQVARGAAGTARAGQQRAATEHASALSHLANSGLAAGLVSSVSTAVELRRLRALGVEAAREQLESAAQARTDAIVAWQEAQRRLRLFEELDARGKAEQAAATEKAAQLLADDLSASRRRNA